MAGLLIGLNSREKSEKKIILPMAGLEDATVFSPSPESPT